MSAIPKKNLQAFYRKVGETIVEWFSSLECPDCKANSSIDWIFKDYSGGKPQLLCRNCGRTYPIKGLQFKNRTPRNESTRKLKATNNLCLPNIKLDEL